MWAMAAAALDSSGRDRGEARAPAALRAAGLAEIPGVKDRGDLRARIADPVRDGDSGVIGLADLVDSTEAIAGWVAETASGPDRPLVIGGDCSLLPGVFAGLRRLGAETLVGISVADLEPERDPGGEHAARVVALLRELLG